MLVAATPQLKWEWLEEETLFVLFLADCFRTNTTKAASTTYLSRFCQYVGSTCLLIMSSKSPEIYFFFISESVSGYHYVTL